MDLKPCPFCGEKKDFESWSLPEEDWNNEIYVRCQNCGAMGPPCDTWPKSKATWDERREER